MRPRSQAAVVSRYRCGCTRLAHQVENGLALYYHQTGSVMIASASPPKKELMQKNIRMSSTLVMTRPLSFRRDHGGAKGPFLQSVVRDGVSRSLRPKINFHVKRLRNFCLHCNPAPLGSCRRLAITSQIAKLRCSTLENVCRFKISAALTGGAALVLIAPGKRSGDASD